MRATELTSARTATRDWASGSNPAARLRPFLPLVARIGVGLVLLVAAGSLVSWSSILELLKQTDARYASVAVALLLPNLGLQHVKWLRLLRLTEPVTRPWEATSSLLAGFALGLVTPGRVGEIGRGLFLPEHDRLQTTLLAAVDKLTTLAVILLAGMAGLAWTLSPEVAGVTSWPVAALGVVAGSGLLGLTLAPRPASALLGRIPGDRLRAAGKKLEQGVWAQTSLRFRLGIVGLSLAFYVTFVLQFVLFVSAFTGTLQPEYPLAAVLTLFTKSLLPVSFGDLGIREGTAALVFARIGVVPAAAFNGALLLFAANVVLPGLLGAALVLLRRVRVNQKKKR